MAAGRGASALRTVGHSQVDTWIDIVTKSRANQWSRIGIDTALAASSKAKLDEVGVSRVFYTEREGDFSMYVDAVARTVAPSSYCEPSLAVSVPRLSADSLRETFAKF